MRGRKYKNTDEESAAWIKHFREKCCKEMQKPEMQKIKKMMEKKMSVAIKPRWLTDEEIKRLVKEEPDLAKKMARSGPISLTVEEYDTLNYMFPTWAHDFFGKSQEWPL